MNRRVSERLHLRKRLSIYFALPGDRLVPLVSNMQE